MTVLAFTRPARRLADSVKTAEEMGFTVFAAPSLDIIPGSEAEIGKITERIGRGDFDIVVFTSPSSAEESVRAQSTLPGILGRVKVLSIGPGTGKALAHAGIEHDTVPRDYSSKGIAEYLKDSVSGKRILLMRSDKGSRVLVDELVSSGADVTEFFPYRLEPSEMTPELRRMIEEGASGGIDAFAFSSPLSAHSFIDHCLNEIGPEKTMRMLRGSLIAAIGKPTEAELRRLGIDADIVPERSTFRDMLEAMKEAKRTVR